MHRKNKKSVQKAILGTRKQPLYNSFYDSSQLRNKTEKPSRKHRIPDSKLSDVILMRDDSAHLKIRHLDSSSKREKTKAWVNPYIVDYMVQQKEMSKKVVSTSFQSDRSKHESSLDEEDDQKRSKSQSLRKAFHKRSKTDHHNQVSSPIPDAESFKMVSEYLENPFIQ